MGLDTKTDRLTDRQSLRDSDSDSSYQSLLHLQQDSSKPTCPAIADQRPARLLAQRAQNQHEFCQPVKISEALHSPLPQRTGNPAQRSSAGYPLAARQIQPAAARALRQSVAHNRPFSGPAHQQLQRLPSASCRPASISNKRGQLCSVTWSCSNIPLVLCDCVSTPHWCYVVASQHVYTPTPMYALWVPKHSSASVTVHSHVRMAEISTYD
jgi:hypothetical protein